MYTVERKKVYKLSVGFTEFVVNFTHSLSISERCCLHDDIVKEFSSRIFDKIKDVEKDDVVEQIFTEELPFTPYKENDIPFGSVIMLNIPVGNRPFTLLFNEIDFVHSSWHVSLACDLIISLLSDLRFQRFLPLLVKFLS